MLVGSQITPPLPPPNGNWATAHFQVIHAASAVTSSSAGVIANAALRRAERHVVLNAIAGKDLDLAVVHLDRARDDDLALGMREHPPETGLEIQNARGPLELPEHGAKNTALLRHQFLEDTTSR